MDYLYFPKSKHKFRILITLTIFLAGCSIETEPLLNGSVETNFTQIAPTIGGRLEEINVKIGQPIKKGELLFRLNNTKELSALNEVTARVISIEESVKDLQTGGRKDEIDVVAHRLAEAKALYQQAQIDYNRQLKLFREGLIAKSLFDQAKTDRSTAKEKVESINSQLQVIKSPARASKTSSQKALANAMRELHKQKLWNYSQKEVFTPSYYEDYIVENVYFQVGEFVPAGVPVINLFAPNDVFIRFYIQETDLSAIKLGDEVIIECDGCQSQKAEINYIASYAEFTPPVIYNRENRSKLVYRVEALAQKPKNLNLGMPVDIKIN